jgi:dTDP-4-dehydrorhamnose reductase
MPAGTGVGVLVLGAAGLVGSHLLESRKGKGVEAVDQRDPRDIGTPVESFLRLDLTVEENARQLVRRTHCAVVVNYAASTDVDGCEKERPGALPDGEASGACWRLNAELPGWLAEECAKRDIFLVHVSTDFIFDGASGPYPEDATPSPFGPKVGWYGYTKGVGEFRVRSKCPNGSAVVRISYPYRARFPAKLDFARNLISRCIEGKLYPLYTDQVITPTWIPDVTGAVEAIMAKRSPGVYHVASPLTTTPYKFARSLFLEMGLITEDLATSRMESAVTTGKAPRPLKGGLQVRDILSLGVDPTSYIMGIRMFASENRTSLRMAGCRDAPS